MSENSEIRRLVQGLIQEELENQSQVQGITPNEQGVISKVNPDGTVNVTTSSGAVHLNVGTPIRRVIGQQVTVVTADGRKVAV